MGPNIVLGEIIESATPSIHAKHQSLYKLGGLIIGELLGTFLFLTSGMLIVQSISLHAALSDVLPVPQFLSISVGFGLLLFLAVIVVGPICGAALNPAVLVALLITQQVQPVQAVCMFASQVLGSFLASWFARGLTSSHAYFNTTLSPVTSIAQGFFLELFGTLSLCLAVLSALNDPQLNTFEVASIIGASLTIGHLYGIFFTGASYNPVRAFGPAVTTGTFQEHHWIYWIGPIAGALIAALVFIVFRHVRGKS